MSQVKLEILDLPSQRYIYKYISLDQSKNKAEGNNFPVLILQNLEE